MVPGIGVLKLLRLFQVDRQPVISKLPSHRTERGLYVLLDASGDVHRGNLDRMIRNFYKIKFKTGYPHPVINTGFTPARYVRLYGFKFRKGHYIIP